MATVYKILSPCLKECYVGSTSQKVERRWSKHRAGDCRSIVLFEKYGYDNCKFVVLEVCPLEERREKEQWWMDHSVGTVNEMKAINRTKEDHKECNKKYYEANTDKIKAHVKEYYEANRDKIKARMKEYYETNRDKRKARMKEYYEARKAMNQIGK